MPSPSQTNLVNVFDAALFQTQTQLIWQQQKLSTNGYILHFLHLRFIFIMLALFRPFYYLLFISHCQTHKENRNRSKQNRIERNESLLSFFSFFFYSTALANK